MKGRSGGTASGDIPDCTTYVATWCVAEVGFFGVCHICVGGRVPGRFTHVRWYGHSTALLPMMALEVEADAHRACDLGTAT